MKLKINFKNHYSKIYIIKNYIRFIIGKKYDEKIVSNKFVRHPDENIIKIASIDTILSFYLAFIYTELPYYSKERLLCMAKFLFDVEEKNKLEQKGLLKRFSINCYGKQMTMEEIRSEKAKKYKELMNNKNSPEYQKWFLKYTPSANSEKNDSERKKKTYKKRTRNNTTRKYRNIFGKKSDYLY